MNRKSKLEAAVEMRSEWENRTSGSNEFYVWLMEELNKESADESDTLWD